MHGRHGVVLEARHADRCLPQERGGRALLHGEHQAAVVLVRVEAATGKERTKNYTFIEGTLTFERVMLSITIKRKNKKEAASGDRKEGASEKSDIETFSYVYH